MIRKLAAALVLTALMIGPAVARSDFARAKALLRTHTPFVMVIVPMEFLAADKIKDGAEIETQADWAHDLNEWTSRHGDVSVVVVPIGDYRRLVDAPIVNKPCATLFFRGGQVAQYDADCVTAPYDDGLAWIRSGKLTPSVHLRISKVEARKSPSL